MTTPRVPRRLGSAAKKFSAHTHVRRIAAAIADAAWRKGPGVRAWVWPCGTVLMTRVDSDADRYLLNRYAQHLAGTWREGAIETRIMRDLQAARGAA